jgi:hypothetical protein
MWIRIRGRLSTAVVATILGSLIGLGSVGILASLVTLRMYVHVAPLWVALIGGGSVALGVPFWALSFGLLAIFITWGYTLYAAKHLGD